MRSEGVSASAASKLDARSRSIVPRHWTMASTLLLSLPRRRGSPTIPSEPTRPTSADLPSASSATIDTQPVSGKYTAGIGSSGVISTCFWSRTSCSSRGQSFASSPRGRAASNRFRGVGAGAFSEAKHLLPCVGFGGSPRVSQPPAPGDLGGRYIAHGGQSTLKQEDGC